MEEEMRALMKNNTWEITELLLNKKLVGCKWDFTINYKVNGTIKRYKEILVAKGFTQTYRMDYEETFTSVTKMNTTNSSTMCSYSRLGLS